MTPQQSGAGSRAIPHWLSAAADVVEVTEGDGATVTGADGEAYLDFLSQRYGVNAGHGNRAIVAPPLLVDEADVDRGVEARDEAIGAVFG